MLGVAIALESRHLRFSKTASISEADGTILRVPHVANKCRLFSVATHVFSEFCWLRVVAFVFRSCESSTNSESKDQTNR